MALSMVNGLLKQGFAGSALSVSEPSSTQRERFATLGVETTPENLTAIANADVVVLAVKPQIAANVVRELPLQSDQVLLSIAAGIPLSALSAWCPEGQPIVRAMPNTPALLGAGMSGLFANDKCDAAQRDAAEAVLQAAGQTLWVDREALIDAVTAVSGSGPAYYFLLMEAMADAGVALGLSREDATRLTLQTAHGAALMALEPDSDPAQLRRNVTSPGGTTQAAIEHFLDNGFADLVKDALGAADQRARALAEEFGD